MTENEETYQAYLKEATVREKGVEKKVWVAHAWLEVQDAHLSVKIPDAQLMKRWGITAEELAELDRGETTLADFTLKVVDLDGPTSLIMLSAPDLHGSRRSWTSADDLHDWVTEVLPFGYKATDLLTDEEAVALMGEA